MNSNATLILQMFILVNNKINLYTNKPQLSRRAVSSVYNRDESFGKRESVETALLIRIIDKRIISL